MANNGVMTPPDSRAPTVEPHGKGKGTEMEIDTDDELWDALRVSKELSEYVGQKKIICNNKAPKRDELVKFLKDRGTTAQMVVDHFAPDGYTGGPSKFYQKLPTAEEQPEGGSAIEQAAMNTTTLLASAAEAAKGESHDPDVIAAIGAANGAATKQVAEQAAAAKAAAEKKKAAEEAEKKKAAEEAEKKKAAEEAEKKKAAEEAEKKKKAAEEAEKKKAAEEAEKKKKADESGDNQADESGENQTDESGENQTDESGENQTDESGENQTDESGENQTDESGENQTDESGKNQTDEAEMQGGEARELSEADKEFLANPEVRAFLDQLTAVPKETVWDLSCRFQDKCQGDLLQFWFFWDQVLRDNLAEEKITQVVENYHDGIWSAWFGTQKIREELAYQHLLELRGLTKYDEEFNPEFNPVEAIKEYNKKRHADFDPAARRFIIDDPEDKTVKIEAEIVGLSPFNNSNLIVWLPSRGTYSNAVRTYTIFGSDIPDEFRRYLDKGGGLAIERVTADAANKARLNIDNINLISVIHTRRGKSTPWEHAFIEVDGRARIWAKGAVTQGDGWDKKTIDALLLAYIDSAGQTKPKKPTEVSATTNTRYRTSNSTPRYELRPRSN